MNDIKKNNTNLPDKCTMLLAHSDYLVNIPHSNLSTVCVPLTDDLRHRILTYFANLANGRNGTYAERSRIAVTPYLLTAIREKCQKTSLV